MPFTLVSLYSEKKKKKGCQEKTPHMLEDGALCKN